MKENSTVLQHECTNYKMLAFDWVILQKKFQHPYRGCKLCGLGGSMMREMENGK
jgi:hypothetical protein